MLDGTGTADHARESEMAISNWTEADSKRAQDAWAEYQQHHDMSKRIGQIAGIEPVSGSVWFGDSIQDVVVQRDADGVTAGRQSLTRASTANWNCPSDYDHM